MQNFVLLSMSTLPYRARIPLTRHRCGDHSCCTYGDRTCFRPWLSWSTDWFLESLQVARSYSIGEGIQHEEMPASISCRDGRRLHLAIGHGLGRPDRGSGLVQALAYHAPGRGSRSRNLVWMDREVSSLDAYTTGELVYGRYSM